MIIEECSFSLEIQTKVFGAKKKTQKQKTSGTYLSCVHSLVIFTLNFIIFWLPTTILKAMLFLRVLFTYYLKLYHEKIKRYLVPPKLGRTLYRFLPDLPPYNSYFRKLAIIISFSTFWDLRLLQPTNVFLKDLGASYPFEYNHQAI